MKPTNEPRLPVDRSFHIRPWICADCGELHDRDINAAKNILRRAELSASVDGNERSSLRVPPSRASRSRKAGTRTARTMA